MSSFMTITQLSRIGLKRFGDNVKISNRAILYNPSNIEIGNNVRIDDGVILSAGSNGYIHINNHVHIASYTGVWGSQGITLEDYSNISSGCKIYTESDDYSGEYLMGPTIPDMYRKTDKGSITLSKYSVIGANSILMPGVSISKGSVIGANSMVKRNDKIEEWKIYGGSPLRFIKDRSNNMELLAKEMEHK